MAGWGDGQAAAGSGAVAASLGMVGPRLRGVREGRGLTLTRAAEQTGISKSTLLWLENGQRRPASELLLLLADAYRVPIVDVVGAPPVGDPRIRLKPRRVHGRTVLPLTGPGGVRAWKVVIPPSTSTSALRTHDGFEWLYVLAGRMRLVLGSTGQGPAEVLSIFGRPETACASARPPPKPRSCAPTRITTDRRNR